MKSIRGSASPLTAASAAVPNGSNSATLLSFDQVMAIFRRQSRLIAICTAVGIVLGLVVAMTSTRLYIASASLSISPPDLAGEASGSDRGLDTGAVDSEVEVLRSNRIAIAVAEALDLKDDPRFMDPSDSLIGGFFGHLRSLLPGGGGADKLTPEEAAALELADIVTALDASAWIDRVGESYVLKIDFTSPYPDLAANIANAYVAAYLSNQVGTRATSARHTGDWLASQLADARQRALDADLAAQRFRAGMPATAGSDAAAILDPKSDSAQRIVQLRQLDRESDFYRNLYQSLLGRYQDALEQQSSPVTAARIISPATPPLTPSLPRKSLVLALAAIAGAGVGVAAAAMRELRDRSFRTGSQVRDELAMPYLGALPRIAPTTPAATKGLVRPALLRQSIDAAPSPFADTLRGALATVDAWRDTYGSGDTPPCVIGIASALPREGRTTVAANLALLAAASGARTLLVDGDRGTRGLTQALAPDAPRAPRDPITDPATGLAFLPALEDGNGVGNGLSALLKTLHASGATPYDYVFVDLPAAAPHSDLRAVWRHLDGVLMLAAWGRTPRALVASLLSEETDLRRKVIGCLLNDVDTASVPLYADRSSPDFYRTDLPTDDTSWLDRLRALVGKRAA